MSALLPPELLLSLNRQYPCRNAQIRQLAHLLAPSCPTPATLVVYGLPSTGKTSITRQIADDLSLAHAYINCAECITARHLYEKIAFTVLEALGDDDEILRLQQQKLGKCENIAALSTQLQSLLEGRNGTFVLMLDGIDRQREAPPTLIPAISRLGELIPNLATVLIFSAPTPRPLLLHSAGVPYVHFPAYTHKEALTIALASPPPQAPQSISSNFPSPTIDKLYPPFLSTLLASLVLPSTSQALPALRAASIKLWPLFIAPVLSGETPPGLSSSSPEWDFPRLLLRNRSLFQSESILLDRLAPTNPSIPTTITTTNRQTSTPNSPPIKPKAPPLLPYVPTLTLLSALLASSVPSKQDPMIFSSFTNGRNKSIRRRGKGRPPSATSTPTKSPNRVSKTSSNTSTTLRPFPLERLTAILRTFASPSELPSKKANEGAMSDLVIAELTTLERLRLVVPTSAAGDALGDVKYKINVSKEFVRKLVREWGMESDWRNWEDVGIF